LKVISAEFVTSAAPGLAAGDSVPAQGGPPAMTGIPHDGLPQIAMTGRSNVGKSTLLNALCRQKVARTSAAPGKTRLANVYRVTVEGLGPGKRSLYLVDLPGYGYARGGGDGADELRAVAEGYFRAATPVARHVSGAALLLVDSRHPGLESDVQAARWLASLDVEYRVVATKIDKLSRAERARNIKALEETLGTTPLAVSAASGEGMDALWKTIASLARTGHG
jgi:GTP-binding protein